MRRLVAGLPRDTRLLMGARAARSLGQGALIVDFALYLKALGWSAPAIGALFTGGLVVDALLAFAVGPLSDRFGRKRFLLCYEGAQAVAAVVAIVTAMPALLAAAAIVGGLGRGANGSSGPFTPVELSWLSQPLSPRSRGAIYSANMAIGFTGMGIGALLGGLPVVFSHYLTGPLAFRPLFGLSLAGSLVCLLLFSLAADRPAPRPEVSDDDAGREETRRENSLLLRLLGINALNGVAIGLIGPLMAYWFSVRFGQGPDDIAPVMALAYFVTAASSMGAARLVARLGVVRSVVWMRVSAAIILILLPLVPSFWMAAALHIARSALNRGTAGTRQALMVSLVRSHRQGAAVSTGSAAVQLPRAAGPLFAGLFFGVGMLAAPFYIAAAFFGAHIYFYRRTFSGHDPMRH